MKDRRTIDHRDFSKPYEIRKVIDQLYVEAHAHRAEPYLATRLNLAIDYLKEYNRLIDNMYLASLKR